MTGRPTKLTPEIVSRILDSLRAGIGRDTAIAAAGIARSSFYAWYARGRNARRGAFSDFSDAVKKAEADAAIRNITIIQKAALGGELILRTMVTKPDGTTITVEKKTPPNWQPAAWWLERKYPQQWGRTARIERTERPVESQLIWIHDRIRREMEAQDHALCE